ncbi:type II toxin-antitoxin system Phd/YefM family antitoxin [Deferrisoma palaeochoriense]
MGTTVSATAAKIRFGELLRWVSEHREGVVIERRGRPRAVLLSFEEYQELKRARDHVERHRALEELRALADAAGSRTVDLSPEDRNRLADDLVREAVSRLEEKGKVRFRGP